MEPSSQKAASQATLGPKFLGQVNNAKGRIVAAQQLFDFGGLGFVRI